MCSNTHEAQKQIEREYGCRYSALLELPYFNVVRMCIIDPMHNLLLGTAKHMLLVWKSCKLLKDDFHIMQDIIDAFVVPDDVGRIPSKISSFAGFTAEQWKNWTLLYSLPALKNILPFNHYNCWLLFVKACKLICCRSITLNQLEEAGTLLVSFCKKFEDLYGSAFCTINLHLHRHLKECIEDFGPVYAFWLFSFERLNGILGNYHTNNHNISLQLMRRYLIDAEYGIHNWPIEYKNEFASLLHNYKYNKGSLMASNLEMALYSSDPQITSLPPVHESALLYFEKQRLTDLVAHVQELQLAQHDLTILTLYKKSKALIINGFVLGSKSSRYTTSAHVMVKRNATDSHLQLALIHHFLEVDILHTCDEPYSENSACSKWFASVSYYCEHQCRVWYGSSVEVWSTVTSQDIHFIPISWIKCHVAYSKQNVNFGRIIGIEKVLIVSPLGLL